jgi:hypothetical protein
MPLARGEGDTAPGHPAKDASGRWREGDGGAATTETLSNTIGHIDKVLAWQSNVTRTYKHRETLASKLNDLSKHPPRPPPALHTPQSSASSLLPRLAVLLHCQTHPPREEWCSPKV